MAMQFKRRARAARAAFVLGRQETPDEREEREDMERRRAAAERIATLVNAAPFQVWFPTDSQAAWIPGFFTESKGRR